MTHTRQELRILLKNNIEYLKFLANTEEVAFDGQPHFNKQTGGVFVITRGMARYILQEFERKCSRCQIVKPEDEFRIEIDSRSGKERFEARCKECEREISRQYYQENKQPVKLRAAMRMRC